MGANFETMTVPGSTIRNDVRAAFLRAQDQDRYENGHSYSGGFGMATGLHFPEMTFPTEREASDRLHENCVKWEDAQAVTFLNEKGEATWLIGALCAS